MTPKPRQMTPKWLEHLRSIAGAKSVRKSAASRQNGKLGGRPPRPRQNACNAAETPTMAQ